MQQRNLYLHQKKYRKHDKQIFINAFYFFPNFANVYLAISTIEQVHRRNTKMTRKKRQRIWFVEPEDEKREERFVAVCKYQPAGLQTLTLLGGEQQEDKSQESSANIGNSI